MSTFEVSAVDERVKMSDRALALISDVLAVLSASELIFPESGEVFMCDERGERGLSACLTPPPGRRRRISRSVCVPISVDFDNGSITPGPSQNGNAPFTRTSSLFVRLAEKTGAELIVKSYYGWVIGADLKLNRGSLGPKTDAVGVLRAISESGRDIRRYQGVVRLADESVLLIFKQDAMSFIDAYATARLAAHEHYERIGIPAPPGTSFAAIFRSDGVILGTLALHRDGTASPYILPDFRGGIGLGLVRLLWKRRKSVLTAPACDVERFYKAWGFLENEEARHDHGLVELLPPTAHNKARPAVTAAIIAPRARKVLFGFRAGEGVISPDHWSLPITLGVPGIAESGSGAKPEPPVSMPDQIRPEFTEEYYAGYPDEKVVRNLVGYFVLAPELEDKYLASEWFPRTSEFRFFRWVSLRQALTLRPMTIEMRMILRKITTMLKN